ncbi:hypothetical protein AABB24_032536, partial [Solanum stoloniferum]
FFFLSSLSLQPPSPPLSLSNQPPPLSLFFSDRRPSLSSLCQQQPALPLFSFLLLSAKPAAPTSEGSNNKLRPAVSRSEQQLQPTTSQPLRSAQSAAAARGGGASSLLRPVSFSLSSGQQPETTPAAPRESSSSKL